jgi:hypothetical protein
MPVKLYRGFSGFSGLKAVNRRYMCVQLCTGKIGTRLHTVQ